jgi:hypothetical protein
MYQQEKAPRHLKEKNWRASSWENLDDILESFSEDGSDAMNE